MPRTRTGTLVFKAKQWNARVWVGDARRWVPLETRDKVRAKEMLDEIVAKIARGELAAAAKPEPARARPLEPEARAWCARREAQGVAMAGDELSWFERHIFPGLGPLDVRDIDDVEIRSVLRDAATKLAKGTVGHLRRMLSRFFKSLEKDKVIPANPVRLVEMGDLGRLRSDKRKFTLPTDDEIATLFASGDVDVEIKLVILMARTLGGARGAEVNRWTWDQIDREAFATCTLARAKGDDVQDFIIPEVLRPFLRAWWAGNGSPSSGPVFPVARGPRRGEARGKSAYAVRVRRAFWKAGCRRRELHEDTATTRKLNFHSTGRRAFVSALAASGTNEQTAMALAHHADSRAHKRYQQAQIREVPLAALPSIDAGAAAGWVTAVSKRSRRSGVSVERDTGFEPATSSLGSCAVSAEVRAMPADVAAPGPERYAADLVCSAMSLHEKSPARAATPPRRERQPIDLVWN